MNRCVRYLKNRTLHLNTWFLDREIQQAIRGGTIMKMKRILGIILVGMLAVAGMHTMAYAAAENYISSVATLGDVD